MGVATQAVDKLASQATSRALFVVTKFNPIWNRSVPLPPPTPQQRGRDRREPKANAPQERGGDVSGTRADRAVFAAVGRRKLERRQSFRKRRRRRKSSDLVAHSAFPALCKVFLFDLMHG